CAGSYSRVHCTTPSPRITAPPSESWNSNLSPVPTGLGCLVAMKMPPREMFTAYFWMNVSTSGYFSLIRMDAATRAPERLSSAATLLLYHLLHEAVDRLQCLVELGRIGAAALGQIRLAAAFSADQ